MKPIVMRYVVCAAHRVGDRIICGARHFDPVVRQQIDASEGVDFWKVSDQGFIDQFGKFMERDEAMVIAKLANQIRRDLGINSADLYSEHLY